MLITIDELVGFAAAEGWEYLVAKSGKMVNGMPREYGNADCMFVILAIFLHGVTSSLPHE